MQGWGRLWGTAVAAAICVTAGVVEPETAEAAPGEWRWSADAGPLVFAGEGPAQGGVLLGPTAWFGLSDAVWLLGSIQSGIGLEPTGAILDAHAGLVASFDVLRWVPYAELTVGVSGRTDSLAPAPGLGLGFEYLLDPTWSVGAVGRGRPLFDQDYGGLALSLQLQIAARFGF